MIKIILKARLEGIISDGAITMALFLYENGETHENKIAEALNKSVRQIYRYASELKSAQLLVQKCHYCHLSNLSPVSKYINKPNNEKNEPTTDDFFDKAHTILSKHNKAFLTQSIVPVISKTLKSENLPFDEQILDNILTYCENIFKDKTKKIFNAVKYIEACIQRMWASEYIKIQAKSENTKKEEQLTPNPSPLIVRPNPTPKSQEVWNTVVENISSHISAFQRKLWLDNTVPLDIENNVLILSVQSNFCIEQIKKYTPEIESVLAQFSLKHEFVVEKMAQ